MNISQIVDFSMSPTGVRPSTAERHAKPFFNLVVCHDLFDTLERLKIVLSPLAARYPGLQVNITPRVARSKEQVVDNGPFPT